MADILFHHPVDKIYAGPAQRAYQTILPFAQRVGVNIKTEVNLRERKLGDEVFEDFFKAVEVTWRAPFFSHPGGESSAEAQKRGLALVKRVQAEDPNDAVVLSTHGNLLALILQAFDPSIDFSFWKSLTMPDIYVLFIGKTGEVRYHRLWV